MGNYVYKYVSGDQVIYVGKNDTDLHSRIKQHEREAQFKPYLKECKIYYVELVNSAMSEVVESELIRRYKPVLNVAKTSEWSGLPFPDLEWIEYQEPEKKNGKREPFVPDEETLERHKQKFNDEVKAELEKFKEASRSLYMWGCSDLYYSKKDGRVRIHINAEHTGRELEVLVNLLCDIGTNSYTFIDIFEIFSNDEDNIYWKLGTCFTDFVEDYLPYFPLDQGSKKPKTKELIADVISYRLERALINARRDIMDVYRKRRMYYKPPKGKKEQVSEQLDDFIRNDYKMCMENSAYTNKNVRLLV